MEWIFLLSGLVAGGLIGFGIVKLTFKAKLLEAEKATEIATAKAFQEKSELETKRSVLESQLEAINKEKENLLLKLENESRLRVEAEKTVVVGNEAFQNLQVRLTEERKQLEELEVKFQKEFENIANKILKQNTLEFNQSSTKNMSDLLNPLKEKLLNFEKKVEDTYKQGLKDQTDLKAELKKLHDLSLALDKDAKDLTRALKSDTKKQGNWGEVILERVLERSGLIKDQEYYLQFSAKSEEGSTFRPDVVINLPEEKHLVIDSKVSLTAYTEYAASETDIQRDAALKRHLDSMKKHVKELSEKNYSALLGINSPDFVLMFLPIEPAFGVAVQADNELFNFAWQRKVVIVSPTTLLATLRTVASIWKYEKQSQNALEIARRGGLLYDKFVSFVKDFETVGTSLNRASSVYQEAHKKLTSGRGDLISQAEQLKVMGVTTKKSLPTEFLESGN
jgi:DNA recombination protein RmuC